MAKKAMVEREIKRQKLVDKYAAKRAELKAKGDYIGLSKLPKNSAPARLHNRCNITGVLSFTFQLDYSKVQEGFYERILSATCV